MYKASPLAKKIIKEKNLIIENIKGSGPNGRIIKRDLMKKNEEDNLKFKTIENFQEEQPSQIRKVIAERTSEAFKNIPHFYLRIESKIDKLINLRKIINNTNIKNKVSLNDLFIKAVAIAQKNNPQTMCSWSNNKIIKYKDVDISFAVALKEGLITPIIRSADKKGITEISKETKNLIQKAQKKELLPQEYNGGTITISNLGMYGIDEFDAIINPPQSCILALGHAKKKIVYQNDEMVTATVLKSTLSADHRILDGASAAKFLQNFNKIIENPLEIWIKSKDLKLN